MPKGLILLPENVDTTTTIARPPQDLEIADRKSDGFEVSPTGLVLPKSMGITLPDQGQPKILLPKPEQITTLAVQNTTEAHEAEKPEGNLAAFLYDPMAYLARKVASEEHLGEQHNPGVTELLLRLNFEYQYRVCNRYQEAVERLDYKIKHDSGDTTQDQERVEELKEKATQHDKESLGYSLEMLEHEKTLGRKIKPKDLLDRTTTEIPYYDKFKEEQTTRMVSSPSAMEEVVTAMLEELNAPNIRKSYPEVQEVLDILSETLNLYRGRYEIEIMESDAEKQLAKPEMPSVVKMCSDMLETTSTSPAVRTSIYNLLEQTNIPQEYTETILQKMDTAHDWEHPLAFQLAVETARHNPNSAFSHEQQARREKMLGVLNGNAQTCFDNFDHLLEQSKNLVCAANPERMAAGKIGMEFEFNVKSHVDENAYPDTIQFQYNAFLRGYEIGSNFYDNPPGFEARKRSLDLEHTLDHTEDTLQLRRALLDMPETNYLSSLHIHLDEGRHPNRVNFGGYFSEKGYREVSRVNTFHRTFELRGLVVPLDCEHTIDAARVEDAIEMLICMAEVDAKPAGKLKLGEGPITNWKQIVFGHVCNLYESPEIRLACLKCLQDDRMLRGGYVEGLLNTYDIELLDKLSPQAFPGSHRKLQDMKKNIEQGTGTEEFRQIRLIEMLSLNPENIEMIGTSLEKYPMEVFNLRYLSAPIIVEAIKQNQLVAHKFTDRVISEMRSGVEPVHPEYAIACMDILHAEEVQLETSERVQIACDFARHLLHSTHHFDAKTYKEEMPKYFESLRKFLGPEGMQQAADDMKYYFLQMATHTISTDSSDIILLNYIKFLDDNNIKLTDNELARHFAKSSSEMNSVALAYIFNATILAQPDQYTQSIPGFIHNLSGKGKQLYDWHEENGEAQKLPYMDIVEGLLLAAESSPETFGPIAKKFYSQSSERAIRRDLRTRYLAIVKAMESDKNI